MRAARWVALALLALAGCAGQKTLYAWGDYDEALYDHYRHPQDVDAFARRLSEVIARAEARGQKVPPGLHAEYGFALSEQGRVDEAVRQFEQEEALWPESRAFMQKAIAAARRKVSTAAAPAGGAP